MAQQLITVGQLQSLTRPGLDSIQTLYKSYPTEWKRFFTIRDSYKAVEYSAEMAMINAGARMAEGTDIPLGTMSEQNIIYSKNFQYGVGFNITKISIADNLYKEYFPKGIKAITYNLKIVSENEGIALFDNAFSTSNSEYTFADGLPLCSASHTTSTGTYSNVITNSELNETSAEAMIISAQNLVDAAGQRIMIETRRYLVGIDNQFIVSILQGSTFEPGSANNAINPIGESYGEYNRGGYLVSHYIL